MICNITNMKIKIHSKSDLTLYKEYKPVSINGLCTLNLVRDDENKVFSNYSKYSILFLLFSFFSAKDRGGIRTLCFTLQNLNLKSSSVCWQTMIFTMTCTIVESFKDSFNAIFKLFLQNGIIIHPRCGVYYIFIKY